MFGRVPSASSSRSKAAGNEPPVVLKAKSCAASGSVSLIMTMVPGTWLCGVGEGTGDRFAGGEIDQAVALAVMVPPEVSTQLSVVM